MTTKSITLPTIPKGKEFEDLVSACFQCNGYFIEKSIIEREKKEILELDIIATDYSSQIPAIKLLEVKSGKYGFADIFKVYGWMNYLNIDKGIFVSNALKDEEKLYNQKCETMNIDKIQIDPSNILNDEFLKYFNTSVDKVDLDDIEIWRYSYWVQNHLHKWLISKHKSQKDRKCYEVMMDYFDIINNDIFFVENIYDKIISIYDFYSQHPKLSAKTSHELKGEDFEKEYEDIHKTLYENTFYYGELNDLSITTYLEHRARVSILKNAVDLKIYKDIGDKNKTDKYDQIAGFRISRKIFMPASFNVGLEELSKDKYFHLYPVFWQWFLWVFGGFILLDYKEEEYNLLSQKTNIPVDEIDNALKAFDVLFYREDGWFHDSSPNSNIRGLKLFSNPFRGVGANYRRYKYIKDPYNYDDLKIKGDYTRSDLSKWNNSTVNLLSKRL